MQEHLLSFYIVIVPLLGVAAQWIAWRLRVPSILVLLLVGMILGIWVAPDELIARVTGLPEEQAPTILFPLVSLAVAVILFEGGLTLNWSQLKKDRSFIVARLIIVAASITWVLIALAAYWILGLSWQLALLLGAILIVTGPTVVGPLLRQIRPTRSVGTILQWEGILIDPLGAVAAVLTFEFIAHPEIGWPQSLVLVVKTLLVGTILGIAAAWFLIWMTRNYWIPDFLHGVSFLVVGLAAFWLSNLMAEEAGLVAVTVMGVALANQNSINVEHVLEFKEHLRVLLIGTLFIVLGSRLSIESIMAIGWGVLPFVLLLVFVIRPLSVWLATIGSSWNWRERLFVGLVAPRGIVAASVASVFGLKLSGLDGGDDAMLDAFADASMLAPVTFCVILGTVALCGMAAAPLAHWLKLADRNPQGVLFAGASYPVRQIALEIQRLGYRVVLIDRNYTNVQAARITGLEAYCLNILSEHAQEELDFGGIGYFIAATPSDETNMLASLEYMHAFTRQRVYQLAPDVQDEESGAPWNTIPAARQARLLGDGRLTYRRLASLFGEGKLRRIHVGDEAEAKRLRDQHGDGLLVLAWRTQSGNLKIAAADQPLHIDVGDDVLVLSATQHSSESASEVEQDTVMHESEKIMSRDLPGSPEG